MAMSNDCSCNNCSNDKVKFANVDDDSFVVTIVVDDDLNVDVVDDGS